MASFFNNNAAGFGQASGRDVEQVRSSAFYIEIVIRAILYMIRVLTDSNTRILDFEIGAISPPLAPFHPPRSRHSSFQVFLIIVMLASVFLCSFSSLERLGMRPLPLLRLYRRLFLHKEEIAVLEVSRSIKRMAKARWTNRYGTQ